MRLHLRGSRTQKARARRASACAGSAVLVVLILLAGCGRSWNAVAANDAVPPTIAGVAAPGRVEGRNPSVPLGADVNGVVAEVLVDEGDRVLRGQIVARIECSEVSHLLEAAHAEVLATAKAEERLQRGSRLEELEIARAQLAAANAELVWAQLHARRQRRLYDDEEVVPKEDDDRAQAALRVAENGAAAAGARLRLAEAGPLPEELEAAAATSAAAVAHLHAAEARLDKCTVRSPISGQVTRRHVEPGQAISSFVPQPLVTVADTDHLRVRAEIDERDIGRVTRGQSVDVICDPLGEQRVRGRVTRLMPTMGRKGIRTGDPAEKADRDVREALIELETSHPCLVLGLRVTVLFENTTARTRHGSEPRLE